MERKKLIQRLSALAIAYGVSAAAPVAAAPVDADAALSEGAAAQLSEVVLAEAAPVLQRDDTSRWDNLWGWPESTFYRIWPLLYVGGGESEGDDRPLELLLSES